jgi:glutamate/tyrosine decarboxylase-like PLP-dependent enzyme
MEGAGAVFAENQALRWLADLAGFGPQAGGVFVPGGTVGNLSALVAARHAARASGRLAPLEQGMVATTEYSHSSIVSAGEVMDADLLAVEVRRDRAGGLVRR